jgi:cobalt-zinc-cadmium efflux system outer membrane protein
MVQASVMVLLGLLLCAAPCAADPANGSDADFLGTVDLPRLRSYALAHNPEIQAMEQRWRAAQARPPQEGSLPDPVLNAAYHNEGFDGFTQGHSDFSFLRFGAEQEVPFPGKLSLKRAVAARAADREGALYRGTVLAVMARLRVAYDDYWLAHKSIEVVGSNRDLLEKLAAAADARYRVGEGLQQDVVRAQVELSVLAGRLIGLEQEQQSATALVNAALNRPPAAPLGVPVPMERRPLAHTLDQLEAVAREQSPNLQAADLGVAGAERSLDLAKRQYYPDFVVRADYFNKAAVTPEWEVGAGIRVPLYFWQKQRAGVREAVAGAHEARAARQNASQDVLARLRNLYAQAVSADRLVSLYETAIVPQAEVSLSSASAGYQVGKVDFLTLLNSFTVLNEYQLRSFEERTKFDKVLAQLEETAGLAGGSHD